MAFDPINPDRFFVETQGGNINVTTSGGDFYESGDEGIASNDRRNWDMPYIISPHNPNVLYTGTYRVYQGFGEVPFWDPISDDLTDGTDVMHRYHNITALDESSLTEGLLYVGSGDGNLWRSDDGGDNWNSISAGLPDQYVTDVVPSSEYENVVYATFSGYRDNDFLPRIFRSDDKGENWIDISNNLPDLAINELIVLPESEWERLGSNMPTITVYDLVVNESKNELVAGTFARSIMTYPIDSLVAPVDSTIVSQQEVFALKNTLKINPSLASTYVKIELGNTEPGRDFEIAIINSGGQLVYRQKGSGDFGVFDVDVSDWPAGAYFVKTKMRHGVMDGKFVKI